jgi:hypothetical protein
LRIGDCGLEDAGRGRSGRPVPCLTQYSIFPPPFPATAAGKKACKTNPIWPRPQATDGRNCAKRSQTWGDWGMWEKAVVVWGVARPEARCAKRSQFEESLRFEVSSVQPEKPNQACFDFKLHISNFELPGKRLTASLRTGKSCETNPICRPGRKEVLPRLRHPIIHHPSSIINRPELAVAGGRRMW